MNASIPDSLRIAMLIEKQIRSELTNEEKEELDNWLNSHPHNQLLLDELTVQNVLEGAASLCGFNEEEALGRFLEKHKPEEPEQPIPAIRRIGIIKWTAAAAVVILLAASGYLWFAGKPATPELVTKPKQSIDVEPGKKGAILILADGKQVVLDSLQNGLVATQSGMNVVLRNGELHYAQGNEPAGEMVYNTISVPNGRVFHLQLPDGTKVWINSASSIRYPVAFTGNQRQVEITGEAYFDVVKNSRMPFRVRVNDKAEVEVLGTGFNINAYENEESISTTLIEGSVKITGRHIGVSGEQFSRILTPGQQLQLTEKNGIVLEPDIAKVIAWKNGLFNFEGMELKQVMKQIARWYDVEIVYKGKVPDVKFYGKISRDISLAGLIKGFDGSGVHMSIEQEKQLVVMP
ncbi:FecR family protein [Pseudobacter ginsenosidimutans]|uniref:FecR family protein n=1 Tax=Pseudobacter ginsenosidimutans TaxID=661488 RepID=A0A4Q7MZA0_9BACT|nr:FecR family protein [Pseudobacter ginsenosidimutans]QEC43230.1 DUF4974 domain-containing protein [Pseudobacter ginsenosidimutans]RZS74591.1 FecR family protein [Pseudobacter ginsenosidimutans]